MNRKNGNLVNSLKNVSSFTCTIIGVMAAISWTSAQAVTAIATVDANIISTIAMTTRNGLSFGDIAAGSTSGTVILTPGGVRSATGGTSINSSTPSNPSTFDVQGTANASFSITLPASVLLSDAASHTMTVDSFSSSPTPSGVLDGSGQKTLFVGATINVSANQAFGAYTGQMSVTIDYN